MLWALLRSVKHHIKTNLHLTVSGELHDTSSQSKVRKDRFLFISSNVHSSSPFWDNHSCNDEFVSSYSQSKHGERYQSYLLPLKGISTEMKHPADGEMKAAGPPTGGTPETKDCWESLEHFDKLSSVRWSKTPMLTLEKSDSWDSLIISCCTLKEASCELIVTLWNILKENSRPLTFTYEFPQLSLCLRQKVILEAANLPQLFIIPTIRESSFLICLPNSAF